MSHVRKEARSACSCHAPADGNMNFLPLSPSSLPFGGAGSHLHLHTKSGRGITGYPYMSSSVLDIQM